MLFRSKKKHIAVPDFEDIEDMTDWAEKQLQENGLKGTGSGGATIVQGDGSAGANGGGGGAGGGAGFSGQGGAGGFPGGGGGSGNTTNGGPGGAGLVIVEW